MLNSEGKYLFKARENCEIPLSWEHPKACIPTDSECEHARAGIKKLWICKTSEVQEQVLKVCLVAHTWNPNTMEAEAGVRSLSR